MTKRVGHRGATVGGRPTRVMLLTGGSDKPYALGLASALASQGVYLEFIGSNELDCPEVRAIDGLTFVNLRGDQSEAVPYDVKVRRILRYYARLIRWVTFSRAPILHILWNNRFELLDRTLLMAWYRALGKRVVLTVHNVNAAARDGRDSWLNRRTLRAQYRLCDHLFVHTEAMKRQLVEGFAVEAKRITVIPFGINDTIPRTGVTRTDARRQFGIGDEDRMLLFFGQIAPYKGLEHLVEAMAQLAQQAQPVHLIIAGKVKRGSEDYWDGIQRAIVERGLSALVVEKIGFIPDAEVEPYLEAADAVVLPYVDIFQSGVPFLAFSFGLPVIATDVGSLREDVTDHTGVLCRPGDPADLARAITDFYRESDRWTSRDTRAHIRRFADDRHSWVTVSTLTTAAYAGVFQAPGGRRRASDLQEPQEGTSECRE